MDVLNGIVTGAIAIGLAWLVMTPRYREGLLIKLGLVCMAIGFAGVSYMSLSSMWWAIPRALAAIHVGLVVVVVGYYRRCRRAGHPLRRSTDFGGLGEGVRHEHRR